jgi:hypothetical protein
MDGGEGDEGVRGVSLAGRTDALGRILGLEQEGVPRESADLVNSLTHA